MQVEDVGTAPSSCSSLYVAEYWKALPPGTGSASAPKDGAGVTYCHHVRGSMACVDATGHVVRRDASAGGLALARSGSRSDGKTTPTTASSARPPVYA